MDRKEKADRDLAKWWRRLKTAFHKVEKLQAAADRYAKKESLGLSRGSKKPTRKIRE